MIEINIHNASLTIRNQKISTQGDLKINIICFWDIMYSLSYENLFLNKLFSNKGEIIIQLITFQEVYVKII